LEKEAIAFFEKKLRKNFYSGHQIGRRFLSVRII